MQRNECSVEESAGGVDRRLDVLCEPPGAVDPGDEPLDHPGQNGAADLTRVMMMLLRTAFHPARAQPDLSPGISSTNG